MVCKARKASHQFLVDRILLQRQQRRLQLHQDRARFLEEGLLEFVDHLF